MMRVTSGMWGVLHRSGEHHYRRFAENSPGPVVLQRRRPRAPIVWGFTRPQRLPPHALGWSQQWFRSGIELEVAPEVHDDEPILAIFREETQHECVRAKYGPIHPTRTLAPQDRILASQPQQVAV